MPPITRWFIKASLVYLVAALLVGLLLAAPAAAPLPPFVSALTPVYFHLFMVGWVSQIIFGVVYWMFPKYSRERPRGHDRLALAALGLLNLGLVMRAVGEPLAALRSGAAWSWLLVLSALAQWVAGLAFVANTWPRVKEK